MVDFLKPDRYTSHLYASRIELHYIDNNVWARQTDIIGEHLKNWETIINIVI